MLLNKRLLLALAAILACAPLLWAEDGDDGWVVDYDKGLTMAQAEGKKVLVDFTGSDWCVWCKRLEGEVFSQDDFKTYAKDNFIMVMLDFPNGKKVENAERNNEIKERYKVTGFPTILLLDSKGVPYAQTGYVDGGPEVYIKHLKDLETLSADLKKAFKKVNQTEGDEKKAAVRDFFACVDSVTARDPKHLDFFHNFALVFPDLSSLDPKNEAGFLEKVFKTEVYDLARAKKANEVVAAVEGFLKDKSFVSKDTGAEIVYLAANAAYKGLGNKEKALTLFKKALDMEPTNPRLKDSLEKMVQQIEGEL